MLKSTRRQFLQRAAAVGLFTISGTKSSGQVLGANERINVGVAGIHGQGKAHINAFSGMENVRVIHRIDPDNRLGPTVQDIRRALDDKDLDVISIASCNHWHSLITVWACQAGKDVYVEKPCSHNIFEGRKCVEAARKYKRIVQHGTQRRSGEGYKTVRDIAAGKRGKLQLVHGACLKGRGSIGMKKPGQPPKELDFNLWLGPAPRQPYHGNLVHYNWHWFWDTGNGDIGNNGVHEMDLCRWAIPNATLPKSIISLGGRFGWNDQGQTPNVQMVVYDYGETKLIFQVNNLKPRGGNRIKLAFDENVAVEPVKIKTPSDVKGPGDDRGPGGNIFRNFIACVRSRKPEDLDAHILEGHYSSALGHLANISYQLGNDVPFNKKTNALGDDKETPRMLEWMQDILKDTSIKLDETTYRLGRKLSFDADKEKFIDDAEADALLTRPYRKPFVVPERP